MGVANITNSPALKHSCLGLRKVSFQIIFKSSLFLGPMSSPCAPATKEPAKASTWHFHFL